MVNAIYSKPQVNSVYYWSGNFSLVFLRGVRRANTPLLRAQITTRARVHCEYHHNLSRKVKRGSGAGGRYNFVLKWLAQRFYYTPLKFWKFVQKQYSSVRQSDFSGFGKCSSADKRYVRRCVVWVAKRTFFYDCQVFF